MLNASQAVILTGNIVTFENQKKLQQELGLVETRIRNAAGLEHYKLLYDAKIVGNPIDDPLVNDNLTAIQIQFRDALINVGYEIGRDTNTGYWYVSWEQQGIEQLVSVYIVYTTLAPGPLSTGTINSIDTYFSNLTPKVRNKVTVVSVNGGDIDELTFGGTTSTYYQYVVVTDQPNTTDYSSGIKAALVSSGLGYNDSVGTDNVEVYKVV